MLDVKMMRQNFDYVQEKLMTRGVKKETLAEFMELESRGPSGLRKTMS